MDKRPLIVTTTVNLPVAKVWEYWTTPEHIKQWNNASADWHTPAASNDLRIGGKFSATMAARDGSMSFEFGGQYTTVDRHELIEYVLGDGRQVSVRFKEADGSTTVEERFEPEQTNPIEMQQAGWQSIMDNFKRYAEENG